MAIFAIVFGSLVSLGGFSVFVASIAMGGNPGSFIVAVFLIALGVPCILMGVKRLKEKKGTTKTAQAAHSPNETANVYITEDKAHPTSMLAYNQQTEDEFGINVCREKDNMGTRQDIFDKASAFWTARRSSVKKAPLVLYIFKSEQDAKEALLDLPCIQIAADTGKLICTEVLTFGYYPILDSFEAILCGDDLTYELWEQAKNSFVNHGGKLKNEQAPEIKTPEQSDSPVRLETVKFLREQHVNDQYGDAIYCVFEASDADTAKEFLSRNPVDKRLFYIVVETPDGHYGRDINGIYKE